MMMRLPILHQYCRTDVTAYCPSDAYALPITRTENKAVAVPSFLLPTTYTLSYNLLPRAYY